MSLISSLFKSKKQNLTPQQDFPKQENLYFTSEDARSKGVNLRDLTAAKLRGEGIGFGENFLGKATNPAIASREARFNEIEMPAINSQLSSRGLARSAGPNLATDVITRAGQNKERDVNDLISQFYVLNEKQKKTDLMEARGEAERLQGQQADLLGQSAMASERLANSTAADARARETADRGLAGNILQSGAQLAVPALGAFQSLTGAIPGLSGVSNMFGQAQGGMKQFNQNVGQNILGKVNSSQLNSMTLEQLLALLQ